MSGKGLMKNMNSRQRLMVNISAGVVGLTALIWGGSAVAKSDFIAQPRENVAQYLALKSLEWSPEGYIENLNFQISEGEVDEYSSVLEQTAFVLNESDLLNRQFRDYLFTTNADGAGQETGFATCGPFYEASSDEQKTQFVLDNIENVPTDQYGSILKAMGLSIFEEIKEWASGGE